MKLKQWIIRISKAFYTRLVMQRFLLLFHFQIHLLDFWFNKYMSIGFAILTFDNCRVDRSLFAIFWQPELKRIWISILFVNIRLSL